MRSASAPSAGRRHAIRLLALFLLFVCLAGAACLAVNAYVRAASAGRILSPEDAAALNADCILVLGAGVRTDGSPSHMLEDRLLTALSLYQSGAAPKLLMSGDHGRIDYNEVGTMKAYAIREGVPASDIFMDHAGFSTYESLYRARDVFCAERIVIVTQEYHLYRALYIAQSLGIDAWGVCADRRTYSGQSMRNAREAAARVKDFVWCIRQPLPTYLGDTIPVSGDGNQTNDEAAPF
ncbi:MAG: vancomycin high temperature exclusion protein [Eubacteriales bacterium]